jgi:flagellar hook-length control protein FliK
MTSLSVGSTVTSGASTGARGAPSSNDAAPQGFDLLLAGAHSAHDTAKDPVRQLSRDSTNDDRRDADANATTTKKADRRGDTGTTDKTGGSGDTSDGSATKADSGSDQAALAAAVAALALTTPTPVAPEPDATAAAVTPGVEAPAADATAIDANALLALAAESAATAGLDGAGGAEPSTGPVTPPVDPKLLPLPNLATAPVPHADPNANANALAATIAAPPSSSSPPAAAPPDHPRPAPLTVSPTSGAATFAAAPPANAPAVTNVNVDAGATATAAVAPPPPSEQLVSVLTPMRNTQNGTYTLRLELKPPELGRVEMRVEMRDGVLHASIHAEHEGSGQLLRDALGDLRDRLSASGVRTGALTVSDGSVGSRDGRGRAAARPSVASVDATNEDLSQPAQAPLLSTPDSDSEATSLLDVRV